jgi:hypothetical protein
MAGPEDHDDRANSDGQKRTKGQTRKSASRKAASQDAENLIQQAEALQGLLREILGKTAELVKSLKQHQRQRRMLQSTLLSLEELKTLGI